MYNIHNEYKTWSAVLKVNIMGLQNIHIAETGKRIQKFTKHVMLHPIMYNDDDDDCIQRPSLRFFTISSLRREMSPTHTLRLSRRNHVQDHNHVQIICNTLSAYHVQRVVFHLV